MPKRSAVQQTCSIPDCDGKAHCRGWCPKHYTRWQRHGDPLFLKPTTGADHWAWKGDEAGYNAIHCYVKSRYPKTGVCQWCGKKPERWTEWANLDGKYNREDRSSWVELCRKGHHHYDRPRPTHCPHGHEYVPSNIYWSSQGSPRCKICHLAERKRRKARALS